MKSSTYKILIADEEVKYASMIKRLTETSLENVKVLDRVASGKEAILCMKESKPDLLIVDVKLSDLSGIEVIKEIRKFNKDVYIIILTQYDNFEFIQAAVSSAISAYLLKPISKQMLTYEIQKILVLLEDETNKKVAALRREHSRLECLKFTEFSYIYGILFNDEYVKDIASYHNELNLSDKGYIIYIDLKSKKKDKIIDLQRASRPLYKCIKETISASNNCVVGPRISNSIIVFVCEDKSQGAEEKNKIFEMCGKVIENINSVLDIDIEIGVGSIKNENEIYDSYEEARKALRFKKEGNEDRVHIYNREMKQRQIQKTYIEVERLLVTNIKYGQNQVFEYFTNLLELNEDLTLEVKKVKVLEALVLCCYTGRVENLNENTYLDYDTCLEELKEVSEEGLEGWALRKLQYIMKAIRKRQTNQIPFAIATAVNFIDNHYMDNIQLEDVASRVGFTPQYFSTYFKDEMKRTFLEYITSLRMGKARELIRTKEGSLQEICFLVGYHNPNYFSRIFKKCNGCTPSEYKKRMEAKEGSEKP